MVSIIDYMIHGGVINDEGITREITYETGSTGIKQLINKKNSRTKVFLYIARNASFF